jgi:hypothetical protein
MPTAAAAADLDQHLNSAQTASIGRKSQTFEITNKGQE